MSPPRPRRPPYRPPDTPPRGPNTSARAVLSFDDCPRSSAAFRRVIRRAEKLNISLVLFPTGQCRRAGRFSVAYARRHGHYVFNHSVSHADLTRLSSAAIRRELPSPGRSDQLRPTPVRSRERPRQVRVQGQGHADLVVERGQERLARQVPIPGCPLRRAEPRPGHTVLMHMQWRGFSGSALRDMRSGLARRGIKVCRNFPARHQRSRAAHCAASGEDVTLRPVSGRGRRPPGGPEGQLPGRLSLIVGAGWMAG